MYRIAICEDEKIFSQTQEKICTDILKRNSIVNKIDIFESAEDFLATFASGEKHYDLILLDIVMGGMNGMELAAEIRKRDEKAAIVFITSSREYALQGYNVNALHYLLKPVDVAVLEKLILSDYKSKFRSEFLCFKSGAQNHRLPVNEIIRAETVGRRVEITLTDSIVTYPGKLTKLLEELPKDQFVRCHQAFAVNIQKTRELTRQSALSVNGVETPVSRTFTKEVQKAFLMNIRRS